MNKMKNQIQVSIADPVESARDFIDIWKCAERDENVETEQFLHFENLEILLKTLTPGRWLLLKKLRCNEPMSIRTLAKELRRDYKNVHTDVRTLENIGLIDRTDKNEIRVPWDIVDAQLRLAA